MEDEMEWGPFGAILWQIHAYARMFGSHEEREQTFDRRHGLDSGGLLPSYWSTFRKDIHRSCGCTCSNRRSLMSMDSSGPVLGWWLGWSAFGFLLQLGGKLAWSLCLWKRDIPLFYSCQHKYLAAQDAWRSRAFRLGRSWPWGSSWSNLVVWRHPWSCRRWKDTNS